ncbi:MAG: ATP synthase F1 subunit delta [Dehalococcoidia bacterium]|nr:ATP synthase F1 subunit delta [Dehalococcoidia bacterium]
MKSLSVVGYYARLAFELAAEEKRLERWRADLHRLAGLSEDSIALHCRELHRSGDDEFFGDISSGVVEFAYILEEHDRLPIRADIAREYEVLLDEYYGIRHAEVVTAMFLDQETRQLIERRLRETTGSRFVLDPVVDPSIIGGIVLKVGDRVIDRSVRARLQSLRLALLNTSDEEMEE